MKGRSVDPLQPRSQYTNEELRGELRHLLKMSNEERLMEAIADTYAEAIAEAQKLERAVPSIRRHSSRWEPFLELLGAARSLIAFSLPQLPKPKE